MADPVSDFDVKDVQVMPAQPPDHDAVRELFRLGLLDGQVPDNDTGADIDDLNAGYFSDEGASGFWVARYGDEVTGMIGVQCLTTDSAEVRRLRVREGFRRCGVGTKLMEQAVGHCRRRGFLKVSLDVRIERGPAIQLFEKFGFVPGRAREIAGRKTLDFYLDLYREPPPDS